ncbi:MAG: prepilin-type N-terminal cleavage/methylation domain-containing protein [Myxococcaceae bacterium]
MKHSGFTLLEVVVAMAILGLALLAIFDLNAGAVASHAYVKRITVATQLARSKMTDLEQELYDKGFELDDVERSGDFAAEGWNGFTWKARILAPHTAGVTADKLLEALFSLPPGEGGGLASLFALGGADGGLSGLASSLGGISNSPLPPGATGPSGTQALGPFASLAQTQVTQLLDQIRRGVREVRLTVSWKDGTRTESLDVVTHVVSLLQGSDRNGTPGVPLGTGGTGAVPGSPTAAAGAAGTGFAGGAAGTGAAGGGNPAFGVPQGPPVNLQRPVGHFQPFSGK